MHFRDNRALGSYGVLICYNTEQSYTVNRVIRHPEIWRISKLQANMASNPGKDANESDVTTAAEEPLDFGDDLLRG